MLYSWDNPAGPWQAGRGSLGFPPRARALGEIDRGMGAIHELSVGVRSGDMDEIAGADRAVALDIERGVGGCQRRQASSGVPSAPRSANSNASCGPPSLLTKSTSLISNRKAVAPAGTSTSDVTREPVVTSSESVNGPGGSPSPF